MVLKRGDSIAAGLAGSESGGINCAVHAVVLRRVDNRGDTSGGHIGRPHREDIGRHI